MQTFKRNATLTASILRHVQRYIADRCDFEIKKKIITNGLACNTYVVYIHKVTIRIYFTRIVINIIYSIYIV
jgi:hypothetical protein